MWANSFPFIGHFQTTMDTDAISTSKITYLAALIFALIFLAASSPLYGFSCSGSLRDDAQTQRSDFQKRLFQLRRIQQQDLLLASRDTQDLVRHAERLNDRGKILVAKIQSELISALLKGQKQPELNFDWPELVSHTDLSENQIAHLGWAFVRFYIDSDATELILEPILEDVARAVSKSNDKDLKFQFIACELYIRLFRLGEDPNSQQIANLLSKLQTNPLYSKSSEAKIVECFVEHMSAESESNHEKSLKALSSAKAIAHDSRNRYFYGKCDLLLGLHFLRTQSLKQSLEAFRSAETTLKNLGANALLQSVRVRIVQVESRLMSSKVQDASATFFFESKRLKKLEKIIGSPAFEHSSMRLKNRVWTSAATASQRLGNRAQAKRQLSKRYSHKSLDENSKDRQELQEYKNLNSQLAQTAVSKNEELMRSSLRVAKAETNVAYLFAYSIIITALGIIAVSWFLIFLFRNRLRRATLDLATERENSAEKQRNYDDLARRLQRVQRMESLGLMAGSVAHDFNNILVGVLGNAEIIQMTDKIDDAEFVQQRIDSIIKSAEKAAGLSRQMLAYAGKQFIERQPVDLNELISQYVPILNSACMDHQTLELNLSAKEIVVKVDPIQIEQVLLNLVTNATEASRSDGKIVVSTGIHSIDEVDEDPSLYGTRTQGGEFGYIEVADNGIGLDQKDLERIFEPFYSNSDTGQGLGLSVVYGIVNGHDGLIQCESEVGKRTSFRILIPTEHSVVNEEPSKLDFHSPNTVNQYGVEHAVLIVDDEESVLDLCERVLKMGQFLTTTALGGRTGIEKLIEVQDDISCILLDVVMPDFGANEFLGELEKRNIDIPVVLMSGFSQTKLEYYQQRPNVKTILQKPFRAIEIQSAIRNVILSSDKKNMPFKTK